MRLYTSVIRELFHRSATGRHKIFSHKKAQKTQMKDSRGSYPSLLAFLFCAFCAFLWLLKVGGVEGVALAHVSGLVASHEPAQTLFRCAVRERVRYNGAGSPALDLVVADSARGS